MKSLTSTPNDGSQTSSKLSALRAKSYIGGNNILYYKMDLVISKFNCHAIIM
jgi:hypothetical protein